VRARGAYVLKAQLRTAAHRAPCQTGSGKTFTMGSGRNIDETTLPTYDDETSGTGTLPARGANRRGGPRRLTSPSPIRRCALCNWPGVIPRAARQIFRRIAALTEEAEAQGLAPPTFRLSCTFVELYNEKFFDLLATGRKEVKLADQSDGTNADFSNATVDDVRARAWLPRARRPRRANGAQWPRVVGRRLRAADHECGAHLCQARPGLAQSDGRQDGDERGVVAVARHLHADAPPSSPHRCGRATARPPAVGEVFGHAGPDEGRSLLSATPTPQVRRKARSRRSSCCPSSTLSTWPARSASPRRWVTLALRSAVRWVDSVLSVRPSWHVPVCGPQRRACAPRKASRST